MKTATLALMCVGLVITSLVFTKGSYAEINPADIAGIWLLNEGDGDEAEDISGNEIHGVIKGKPEWVEGKYGKALELDGVDDSVEVMTNNIGTAEQLTVSVLVKPDEQALGQYGDHKDIVRSHKIGGGTWSINTQTGFNGNDKLQIHVAWIEGGDLWWSPANDVVAVKGEWNYLTVVWDRDAGTAIFYRDGERIAETKPPVGAKPITTGFDIGNDWAGPFKGVIDEVAIFNAALDEDDIKNIGTKGMEWALDPIAVDIQGKLATSWGEMKVK
ncbi:LamG domain-containing protein [Candidatus Poribacteria bacterium]